MTRLTTTTLLITCLVFWSGGSALVLAAGMTTSVPVGVVLDLASGVGREGLTSISMVLEDVKCWYFLSSPLIVHIVWA
jgi:hypothetical protein